jgi:hypothetical protein
VPGGAEARGEETEEQGIETLLFRLSVDHM